MTLLKQKRIKEGMKQCELAVEARISITNLSRYENGWARPCHDTANRIANVLKCEIKDVFPDLLTDEA